METQGFKYETIVDHYSLALESGAIPAGSKLPSLRATRERFGCSLSVALQAFEILEAQGKIYGIEKTGYFAEAKRTNPLPAPEAQTFTLRAQEAKPFSVLSRIVAASTDPSIIPLGAGLPDSDYVPLTALRAEYNRLLKDTPEILNQYDDAIGDPELRSEIRRIMAERGVTAGDGEILPTNGCTEALALAIESCSSAGDVVAIESPVFLGIIQLLKLMKRRIIAIPTSPVSGMDLDKLEEALGNEEIKAVIMTALYQNPLGFVMGEENRIRAVELAKKHNVVLIEDDIYHDCGFEGPAERCLKSYDTDGGVMYCSSFSKTLSPGMRVGWLLGGKRHREAAELKMARTMGNAALNQRVMARYLASGRHEAQALRLRAAMNRQEKEMRALLASEMPEGAAISRPKGGYYLWVELPAAVDTLKLFEKALEAGISIVPGQAFSPERRYGNCMRISFASPITDRIREGVSKLARMIREML